MGNVGRQIARPFQYAVKTGSSQTHETGRYHTGGNILGVSSSIKVNRSDQISISEFDNHLRNVGIPQTAVNFFSCLKYVQIGNRQKKQFEINRQNAKVQKIGVAVNKINSQTMKIAIYWDQFVVNYAAPQTVINYVTRHYGFGYRNSNNSSKTISRGLTGQQLQSIKNSLQAESNKVNVGAKAQKMIQ